MSENYHIGLSREQINKLLMGDTVGKRPYDPRFNKEERVCYKAIRIYVKLLSEEEEMLEPASAFEWW